MSQAAPPTVPRDRSGEILAARWSIERLRRPAGPELVWLGYAKPEVVRFACLACGEPGFKQGVLRAEGRTLYLCGACASHQVHPAPAAVVPTGFALRYRRECLPDLEAAAAAAARAVAGRRPGRVLELAWDDGLAASLIGQHPGWSGTCLDPGRLIGGGVAEPGGFDVVLSDIALHRCGDPQALLLAAAAAAAADARWLLATPDAALLYAAADAATIRGLVGADTVLLPSRIGLQRLLLRVGLSDLELRGDGVCLHAERDPPPADAADAAQAMLNAYLAHCAVSPPEDASLRLGLLVRGFARAVERGDWLAARSLAATLTPALAAAGEAARGAAAEQESLERLLRAAPVCSAALLQAAGSLHLHGEGPSTQALLCFELCAALSSRAHALAPRLMRAEAERQFAARFQAGLVRLRMGEDQAARAAFEALAASDAAAAAAWAAAARAELAGMTAPAADSAGGRKRRTARAAR